MGVDPDQPHRLPGLSIHTPSGDLPCWVLPHLSLGGSLAKSSSRYEKGELTPILDPQRPEGPKPEAVAQTVETKGQQPPWYRVNGKSSSFEIAWSKTGFLPSLPVNLTSSLHRFILIQTLYLKVLHPMFFLIHKMNLVAELYCKFRIHLQAILLRRLKDIMAMQCYQKKYHHFLFHGFITERLPILENTA